MPVTASLSRAQIVSLLGNDPIDLNGGIGTISVCFTTGNPNPVTGAIVAGSTLTRVVFDYTTISSSGTALSGSWKNLGGQAVGYNGSNTPACVFQRIA